MRKQVLSAAAILSLAAPALAAPVAYEFDPAHTAATFTVRHMMLTDVQGEFGKSTGTVIIDDKDITKSSVEVTVDVASVNTREPKRDAHLKSPDFFDVAKNPTLTFKSTKVEKAGDGKLKLTGDLTMHGITKPTTFELVWTNKEVKDPWGNPVLGGMATATVNRHDWKLDWNKALESGGFLVGDDVKITFAFELHKAKTDSATAKK